MFFNYVTERKESNAYETIDVRTVPRYKPDSGDYTHLTNKTRETRVYDTAPPVTRSHYKRRELENVYVNNQLLTRNTTVDEPSYCDVTTGGDNNTNSYLRKTRDQDYNYIDFDVEGAVHIPQP